MSAEPNEKVRILLLEDLPTDVELAQREINRVLPGCDIVVTEDEPGFISAMQNHRPHLVISDFRLPTYDGLSALKFVLKNSPFTPVIILTGSMNEDTAVECMKAGAVDYVIKEHVKRLGPAIESALRRRNLMIDREETEQKLRQSELKFRNLFYTHSAVKMIIDPDDGRILDANPAAANFYGWSVEVLRTMRISDINILPPDEVRKKLDLANEQRKSAFNFNHRKADGSIVDVEALTSLVQNDGKTVLHVIIHDVTEKRRAERQVRLLSHAIEQSPFPVVIADPRGTIEYVNAAFTRKLGYDASDVVGKDTRRFSLELESDSAYDGRWEILLAGNMWSGQLQNRTKSGEVIWFNLMIAPIKDALGRVEHFVAFREDITEKVRMFKEVVAAKEKAEEMVKVKSDFLAAMSHELRTPFIGIMGFAEILMGELQDPELRDMAWKILDSSERIKRTLTGILRITELENSHLILKNSPVNAADMIDETISLYSRRIEEKQLSITRRIDGVRKSYQLDETGMEDIISNILSNAICFTNKGSIDIEAFEAGSDDSRYLVIKVTDTGIGIPEDKIEQIWDEFRQVSEGHSRNYEGTGLGLSIVKKTVDRLGGTITVKSKPGEGSEFTVTIPVITT